MPHSIIVDRISAQGLKNADLVGKSDPYVVLRCDKDEKRTKAKPRSLNPNWEGESFVLAWDGIAPLQVFVFDDDKGHSGDDSLGACMVELHEFIEEMRKSKDFNMPLEIEAEKAGSIHFRCSLQWSNTVPLPTKETSEKATAPVDYTSPAIDATEVETKKEEEDSADAVAVAAAAVAAAAAKAAEQEEKDKKRKEDMQKRQQSSASGAILLVEAAAKKKESEEEERRMGRKVEEDAAAARKAAEDDAAAKKRADEEKALKSEEEIVSKKEEPGTTSGKSSNKSVASTNSSKKGASGTIKAVPAGEEPKSAKGTNKNTSKKNEAKSSNFGDELPSSSPVSVDKGGDGAGDGEGAGEVGVSPGAMAGQLPSEAGSADVEKGEFEEGEEKSKSDDAEIGKAGASHVQRTEATESLQMGKENSLRNAGMGVAAKNYTTHASFDDFKFTAAATATENFHVDSQPSSPRKTVHIPGLQIPLGQFPTSKDPTSISLALSLIALTNVHSSNAMQTDMDSSFAEHMKEVSRRQNAKAAAVAAASSHPLSGRSSEGALSSRRYALKEDRNSTGGIHSVVGLSSEDAAFVAENVLAVAADIARASETGRVERISALWMSLRTSFLQGAEAHREARLVRQLEAVHLSPTKVRARLQVHTARRAQLKTELCSLSDSVGGGSGNMKSSATNGKDKNADSGSPDRLCDEEYTNEEFVVSARKAAEHTKGQEREAKRAAAAAALTIQVDKVEAEEDSAAEFKIAEVILQRRCDHVLRYLFACGANHVDTVTEKPPLATASARGHASMVQVLLKMGANANVTCMGYWTPLLLAAANGHADVVTALCRHKKTNVNARGGKDRTAVMVASAAGHFHCVEALVATRGAVLGVSDGAPEVRAEEEEKKEAERKKKEKEKEKEKEKGSGCQSMTLLVNLALKDEDGKDYKDLVDLEGKERLGDAVQAGTVAFNQEDGKGFDDSDGNDSRSRGSSGGIVLGGTEGALSGKADGRGPSPQTGADGAAEIAGANLMGRSTEAVPANTSSTIVLHALSHFGRKGKGAGGTDASTGGCPYVDPSSKENQAQESFASALARSASLAAAKHSLQSSLQRQSYVLSPLKGQAPMKAVSRNYAPSALSAPTFPSSPSMETVEEPASHLGALLPVMKTKNKDGSVRHSGLPTAPHGYTFASMAMPRSARTESAAKAAPALQGSSPISSINSVITQARQQYREGVGGVGNSRSGASAHSVERMTTGRIAGMGPKLVEALSAADRLMFRYSSTSAAAAKTAAATGTAAGSSSSSTSSELPPPVSYGGLKNMPSKHMLSKVTQVLYRIQLHNNGGSNF